MAVDGGEVYVAGKCGLIPAMVEQYDDAKCGGSGGNKPVFHSLCSL